MASEDELIHDICEAFQMSEASWHEVDAGPSGDGVLFYLAMIGMVEHNPFREPNVQRKVLIFLKEKFLIASERRFTDLEERLKGVYKKHEEII